MPSAACEPSPALPLGCPSHAQAFVHALTPSKIGRIIAIWVGAEAANSETSIALKSSLNGGSGFIHVAEPRERGSKKCDMG